MARRKRKRTCKTCKHYHEKFCVLIKTVRLPSNTPCDLYEVYVRFRNVKLERDGIKWDSVGEYKRWCELKMLEKAGEISDLQRQVTFKLGKNPLTGRTLSLRVDFTYKVGVKMIAEDFKGYPTPEWVIKWAWFHSLPRYAHIEKRVSK